MKSHFRWMISLLMLSAIAMIVAGVLINEELVWGLGLHFYCF